MNLNRHCNPRNQEQWVKSKSSDIYPQPKEVWKHEIYLQIAHGFEAHEFGPRNCYTSKTWQVKVNH